jgi:DNA-3-methyladenine glycosylase
MKPPIRSRRFFERSAEILAKDLLGCILYIRHGRKILSGTIVETESYHESDPASHSFRGRKKRNLPMFLSGGYVYVYFIYGNHFCVNIVAGKKDIGEAVLIRALEPLTGIEQMKVNRKKDDIHDLCSGPGKLCAALGIDKTFNGIDLSGSKNIYLTRSKKIPKKNIIASKRIGLTKGVDKLLRFTIRDSKFVSRK